MKQSTKLLSLFLAMLMVFSCFSVAVNAGFDLSTSSFGGKTNISYNHIDKAEVNADQLAKMIMDGVDGLLAGLIDDDTVNTILGVLSLEIGSFDDICSSLQAGVVDTALGNVGGDLKNLKRTAVKNSKRSNGDVKCLCDVVQLLADNFNGGANLAKVAYGIDKNGSGNKLGVGALYDDSLKLLSLVKIDLGFTIPEALADVKITDDLDLWTLINDIPNQLKPLLYDLLFYGSYKYTKADDDGHANAENKTYAESGVSSLNYDQMISTVLINLLTTPQDYKYVDPDDDPETENSYKVWDEDSIVSKKFAALSEEQKLEKVSITNQSILDILDGLLPLAWEEYGPLGLNNSLKKSIMELMGVDFEEIDAVPASETAVISAFANEEAYTNYAYDDCLMKGTDGLWYYTNVRTRAVLDADGNEVVDEETGKTVTEQKRRYYVANLKEGNELVNLINWDAYNFTTADLDVQADILSKGSIFNSLNHLVYIILNKVINVSELNYGSDTYTSISQIWEDGTTAEKFQSNLAKTVKVVLKRYTKLLFGKSHEYVDAATGMATADFANVVNSSDLIDLVEYIGLPFFDDAMPQLILPTPNDGAKYVFDDGVQVLEFGAVVIRELLTDIVPNVNYDDLIFKAGTLTSAKGRQMASHTADEWVNILLTMGMDLAITELYNIIDFGDTKTDGTGRKVTANYDFAGLFSSADVVSGARWKEELNSIIDWAIAFVGAQTANGDNAALYGINKALVAGYSDPVDKLSAILNTLLPLGFISDCSSANFDFDVNILIDKIVALATDFDVAGILALFGRNTGYNGTFKNTQGNILMNDNLAKVIIDLLNSVLKLVTGNNVIPSATTLTNFITQANIKQLLINLIGGINNRSSQLLTYVFPIVALFIDDWTGKDKISNPSISMNDTIVGADDYTATVKVNFKGLWNSYVQGGTRKYDNRYSYKVTGAAVVSADTAAKDATPGATYGGKSATVTATTLNESTTSVGVTVKGTPNANAVMCRLVVFYDVVANDGTTTLGTGFTTSKIFCAAKAVAATGVQTNILAAQYRHFTTNIVSFDNYGYTDIFSPYFIDISKVTADDITGLKVYNCNWEGTNADYQGAITVSIANGAATQYGISFDLVSGVHNKKSDPIDKYFKVNMDTFYASGVKSGDVASWTLDASMAQWNGEGSKESKCKINKIDTDKNGDVKIYFYSDVERNALLDLVKDEYSAGRKAADYEASAWSAYKAAFDAAALSAYVTGAAMQYNTNRDYATLKANLEAAIEALEAATVEATEGGASSANVTDAQIAALQAAVDAAEEARDGKNYTDYYLYRWDLYTDARNGANNIINASKNAAAAVETQKWTYNTSIKGSELNGYASDIAAATPKYKANYISLLATDLTEEELAANAKAKQNAVKKFNSYEGIDAANAVYMVNTQYSRLVDRATAPADGQYFINAEIASAEAMITAQGDYTDLSWARYQNALAAAKAVANGSNKVTFDAKYELQVARNALRTADEEADYEELNALIAQAEAVLQAEYDNTSLYSNADIDFANILATLGVSALDEKGNEVQLFPGAAKIVASTSYAADDQRKVDRASNALREALAKLTFAGVTVNGTTTDVVGKDADDNDISVTTSHIAKNLTAEEAKALFTVNGAEEKKVSVNGTYALTGVDENDVLTGTGSTITFYKTVSGVKVPMATVAIVVNGDVNGDGAVDVLDATVVELVTNNHAELSGIYFVAGNVDTASEGIVANDYSGVVDIALS